MKLPKISLNFFKKPAKEKRIVTRLGKRSSSVSSPTVAGSRKARRSSSSSKKPRKRSITYYAPSKSKYYPSEPYPAMHRAIRHTAPTVATTQLPNLYSYENQPIASAHFNEWTNANTGAVATNQSFHPYATNQTYLCDKDYGDVVFHQSPACYALPKPQSPTPPSNSTRFKIDQNDIYSEECAIQGAPIGTSINSSNIIYNCGNIGNELCAQKTQHNLLPSKIGAVYDPNKVAFNAMHRKDSKSNVFPDDNNNKLRAIYQSKANAHGFGLPIYGAKLASKKKSDRQRKRKVRNCTFMFVFVCADLLLM